MGNKHTAPKASSAGAAISVPQNHTEITVLPLQCFPDELIYLIQQFHGGAYVSIDQDAPLPYKAFVSKFIANNFGKLGEGEHKRVIFMFPYMQVQSVSYRECLMLLPFLRHNQLTLEKPLFMYEAHLAYPLTMPFFMMRKEPELLKDEKKRIQQLDNFFSLHPAVRNRIQSINLKNVEVSNAMFQMLIKCFPNLKSFAGGILVDRKRIHYREQLVMAFKSEQAGMLVKHTPNLEEFIWSFDRLNPQDVETTLTQLTQVKKIELTTEYSFGFYAKLFSNWQQLEHIRIECRGSNPYDNKIATQQQDDVTFQALRTLPRLQTLHISSFTSSSFKYLLGHETIAYVNISWCQIDTEGMKALGSFKNLKALIMEATSFAREDLQYLQPLKNTLNLLDLQQSSNCGDAGCKYISEITSLKYLYLQNLSQDQIHDEGASMLANLKGLKEIDLRYCDITKATIKTLAESCKNLKRICVDGCSKLKVNSLTTELQALCQQNPEIHVPLLVKAIISSM